MKLSTALVTLHFIIEMRDIDETICHHVYIINNTSTQRVQNSAEEDPAQIHRLHLDSG